MKQAVKEIAFPVYTIEMEFSECRFDTIDEIVSYLEEQVKSHEAALFIATFDHLKHTTELPQGIVADEIVAAYNIVFCFGLSLQDAEQLALRPRSLGVCETDNGISVSFMEPPMPVANALMEQWARSLLCDGDRQSQASPGSDNLGDAQLHT